MNIEYWNAILSFLDSGNYISVNRTLIRLLGLNEAVIIGELASEARLYAEKEELKDGWFYIKTDKLEDKTGLSAHLQRKALDTLSDLGIVEVSYKGIPRKRYVRINFRQLLEVVNSKSLKPLTNVDQSRLPLVVEDVNDINKQEEVTIKQQTSKRESTRTRKHRKSFRRPTLEEVAEYCKKRNNGIDPQYFIDYQDARGWVLKGGQPMKDWMATIRTWERLEKSGFGNRKSASRSTDGDWQSEYSNARVEVIDNTQEKPTNDDIDLPDYLR